MLNERETPRGIYLCLTQITNTKVSIIGIVNKFI